MRKTVIIFCFLVSFMPLAQGQKTRLGKAPAKPDPAQFTVHVHISGSHIRYSCSGDNSNVTDKVKCANSLYADAVLDGKKVELWGQPTIGKIRAAVLAPGDYLAQVADEAHNADSTVISANYRLLLPDGTVWGCALSGITE